jgi:hypothetical protein
VPFDVLDHEVGTRIVSDRKPVERVREIAAEQGSLARMDQLPDPEGPAQHAEVRVHAHDDHIIDVALLEHVEHFLAVVADGVFASDFNRGDLACGASRARRRPGDPR